MKTELSQFDIVRQRLFPTVMVPTRSELSPCKVDQTRMLMANDGLYLESRKKWGSLIKKLWNNPRGVVFPYGSVAEQDDFITVLHENVMPIISGIMVPKAARLAERGKEWAGFVVWDGHTFIPWAEEMKVTQTSVKFSSHGVKDLPEGMHLVADIHSHHTMEPFFSSLDNYSDVGGVKISVVLGNYRMETGNPKFDWKARYAVEGFFFESETTTNIDNEYFIKELLCGKEGYEENPLGSF